MTIILHVGQKGAKHGGAVFVRWGGGGGGHDGCSSTAKLV